MRFILFLEPNQRVVWQLEFRSIWRLCPARRNVSATEHLRFRIGTQTVCYELWVLAKNIIVPWVWCHNATFNGTTGILEDRDEKNKGGALFFREYGRTASYYANRTFEPVFESTPELIIPANRSADILKANELCGDSYQCKYDYSVSLNRDLAFYTLQYQDGYVNTKKMSKQRGKWTWSSPTEKRPWWL